MKIAEVNFPENIEAYSRRIKNNAFKDFSTVLEKEGINLSNVRSVFDLVSAITQKNEFYIFALFAERIDFRMMPGLNTISKLIKTGVVTKTNALSLIESFLNGLIEYNNLKPQRNTKELSFHFFCKIKNLTLFDLILFMDLSKKYVAKKKFQYLTSSNGLKPSFLFDWLEDYLIKRRTELAQFSKEWEKLLKKQYLKLEHQFSFLSAKDKVLHKFIREELAVNPLFAGQPSDSLIEKAKRIMAQEQYSLMEPQKYLKVGDRSFRVVNAKDIVIEGLLQIGKKYGISSGAEYCYHFKCTPPNLEISIETALDKLSSSYLSKIENSYLAYRGLELSVERLPLKLGQFLTKRAFIKMNLHLEKLNNRSAIKSSIN